MPEPMIQAKSRLIASTRPMVGWRAVVDVFCSTFDEDMIENSTDENEIRFPLFDLFLVCVHDKNRRLSRMRTNLLFRITVPICWYTGVLRRSIFSCRFFLFSRSISNCFPWFFRWSNMSLGQGKKHRETTSVVLLMLTRMRTNKPGNDYYLIIQCKSSMNKFKNEIFSSCKLSTDEIDWLIETSWCE